MLMPNIYQAGIVKSTPIYTNTVILSNCQSGNYRQMKNGQSNNIEKIRKQRNMTREELAAKMGLTATTIYRKERGDRQLRLEELLDYANALECPVNELVGSPQKISVVGFVGAGAKIFPIDDYAAGCGLEPVDAPTGVSDPNICAVIVRGESQEPQLEDGWLLFYKKTSDGVPPDCLGRLCVVKLPDESMMVKKIRQGSKPGLFHLISKNADPILDTSLLWASMVIDIRPS